MGRGADQASGRYQARLWDLVVVVVGASYVLDVARRSKVAWGGGMPDLAHATGLTMLAFGVAVLLVVAGQWVGRLRLRVGGRGGRAWALTWRVAAAGWLAGALVGVAAALQDPAAIGARAPFGNLAGMRLRLAPLMAALGMVGLVLASSPLGPRPSGPRAGPRGGAWPAVMVAALVGLLILGLGHGLIPYLVLMAMDFVSNAMNRAPLVSRPIVFDRLSTATLGALPGLVGCLATAAWVDDDLRAAARDPGGARAPRSWPGVLARVAATALAASGAAHLVLVALPRLSPWLVEGLAAILDPSTIATVVLGCAALAAGIASRGAARLAAGAEPDPVDRPAAGRLPSLGFGPWPRRVLVGVAALACLEVTAAAVLDILGDTEGRWYVPVPLESWLWAFRESPGWFGQSAGSPAWRLAVDRPDDLLIGLVATWLTIRLAGLIARTPPGRPSPLDALAGDRRAFGRFLGWWAALTTVLLASLPVLAVLGVAVAHYAVKWSAR